MRRELLTVSAGVLARITGMKMGDPLDRKIQSGSRRGRIWGGMGIGLILCAFPFVQWGKEPGIEVRAGMEIASRPARGLPDRGFLLERYGMWATMDVIFLEVGMSRNFGEWLGLAGGVWLARSISSPGGKIFFGEKGPLMIAAFSRNPEVYPGLWLEATAGDLQKRRFSLGVHLGFSMRSYRLWIVSQRPGGLHVERFLFYQRGRAYVFNSFFILQWRLSRMKEGSSHAFYFLFSPLAFRWWLDYREFISPPSGSALIRIFRGGWILTMVSFRLALFPYTLNKTGEG